MQEQNYNPLVSIIVITYNSAPFVIETLESAKQQTYKNIELIVSDDCSTDNTVEICRRWIEQNKQRFVRTELITVEKNTGIPANCNRGVRASQGEWVKIIAGDDALLTNCLEIYKEFISKNINATVLHSNVIKYQDNFEEKYILEKTDLAKLRINQFDISPQQQYQILLRSGPVMAATVLIKKEVFDRVGLFDESSKFWEDNPMWLKITGNNIKIHFLNIVGAKYRIHSSSVQRPNQELFSKYKLSRDKYYKEKFVHKLPFIERKINLFLINRNLFLADFFKNKRTYLSRVILIISGYIPSYILSYLKNKYTK